MYKKTSKRILSIALSIALLSSVFNSGTVFSSSDGSASFYQETIIDNCDTNNWTGSSGSVALVNGGVQEGTGAINLSNNVANPANGMKRTFASSIDMSSITSINKALQIWMKVDDLTAVNYIRIDVVSELGLDVDGNFNDSHGKAFEFFPGSFEEGKWTKITINANDTNVNHDWGDLDYSTIKYLSIQTVTIDPKLASVTMDNIAIVDTASKYSIDDCNAKAGWVTGSGSSTVVNTGTYEGTGALKFYNNSPSAINVMNKTFSTTMNMLPITRVDDKALSLWIKIDNLSAVDSIRIDLFSEQGLNADGSVNWINGYGKAWRFPASKFKQDEWTNVIINSANTNVFYSWGTIDYSKVKFISVQTYTTTGGLANVYVDDITMVNYGADQVVETLNNTCDTTDNFIVPQGSLSIVTTDVKRGTGAIKLSGAPNAELGFGRKFVSTVNASGMGVDNGKAFQLWVKVEDTTKINEVYIDIVDEDGFTGPDKNWTHCKRWQFPVSTFTSGEWVKLQLTDFDANSLITWPGNTVNYSKIKDITFCVLVSSAGAQADVQFDEMRLVSLTNTVTGVALKPETTMLVGAKETLVSTFTPEDTANQNEIWTSSDESVVTVASNGLLTAVAAGTADITVETEQGSFTATCSVTVQNPPPPVIFASHTVTDSIITNIQPNSSVDDFLVGVSKRGDTTLVFKKDDNSTLISGTDKVGTGTIIDVYIDGLISTTYTMVIYGDVNGDGNIDVADLVALKRELLSIDNLVGANRTAGDVLFQGSISISSLITIKKYLVGITSSLKQHWLATDIQTPAIMQTTYETEDVVVADYVVTNSQYNADKSGVNDSTEAIQKAINECYNAGGGTVYLPNGKYRITHGITVPAYVSLRGDWEDPDNGNSYGTVILADVASSNSDFPSLFTVGGSAGVMELTIYYPNQSISNVKPYPFTFNIQGSVPLGQNYMLSSIIRCTVINGYKGIMASKYDRSVNEQINIDGFKGTFLNTGLELYNSADASVIHNVRLSNEYWANASAKYHPADRSALDTYTRANGRGFVYGDLEWSQHSNLYAANYNIGMNTVLGLRDKYTQFGGVLYNVALENCVTGLQIDKIDDRVGTGLALANARISASSSAITNNTVGTIKVNGVINGGINGSGKNSVIISGSVIAYPDFDSAQKPIKPKANLFNVKDTYGADNTANQEASDKIQLAIQDANRAGGGIVYMPAGYYKISTPLLIPSGVELRGATSVATRDEFEISLGTVIMAFYGENAADPDNDQALITLQGNNAGVRGIRIVFPRYNASKDYDETGSVKHYPFTIRGTADGVYVVNSAFAGVYNGIEINGGNNYYIKNISSAIYNVGMRIKNSNGGFISTCLMNVTNMCRNGYLRLQNYTQLFSNGWMEGPEQNLYDKIIVPITMKNFKFFDYINSNNQLLQNCFSYGALNTITVSGGSVSAANIGADTYYLVPTTGPMVITKDAGSLQIINMTRFNGTSYSQQLGSTLKIYNRITVYVNNEEDKT